MRLTCLARVVSKQTQRQQREFFGTYIKLNIQNETLLASYLNALISIDHSV